MSPAAAVTKRQTASTPTGPHPDAYADFTPNKWLVSLAVIFGVLMSTIDSSVVNVALPNIQGNVGATQQEITWISTSYLISVVILMPLTNWLSRRFGRKRVYLVSLTIFTVSSFMCGLSRSSLADLVFWRVIQGVGAGTLQPLAQAIFREAFPREEQGLAMGVFGFVVLFGPAIGPTLGGYITDNYSWPWIFFINIPIGIIGFIVATRYLVDPPYMRGGRAGPIDGTGIGLLAVGLATLQTVLEQGQEDDWFASPFICWFTAISVVSLVVFVIWELRSAYPAVDLRILSNVQYSAGTAIGGILGVGLFASLFLLPQYMQLLLGFDAMQSGLALMPRSLVMMLMMPVSGLLYNRVGARPMITIGLLISAYSQWDMGHYTLQTSVQQILVAQVTQGVGFALVFVALSTVALSTIPKPQMTSASGLNNLIRQLGGSIGTAGVVTILTQHIDMARSNLVANTYAGSTDFQQRVGGFAGVFMSHGYSVPAAKSAALSALNGMLEQQSAMIGYDYVFLWIGLLFILCLPLVLLLGPPKRTDSAKAVAAV